MHTHTPPALMTSQPVHLLYWWVQVLLQVVAVAMTASVLRAATAAETGEQGLDPSDLVTVELPPYACSSASEPVVHLVEGMPSSLNAVGADLQVPGPQWLEDARSASR